MMTLVKSSSISVDEGGGDLVKECFLSLETIETWIVLPFRG